MSRSAARSRASAPSAREAESVAQRPRGSAARSRASAPSASGHANSGHSYPGSQCPAGRWSAARLGLAALSLLAGALGAQAQNPAPPQRPPAVERPWPAATGRWVGQPQGPDLRGGQPAAASPAATPLWNTPLGQPAAVRTAQAPQGPLLGSPEMPLPQTPYAPSIQPGYGPEQESSERGQAYAQVPFGQGPYGQVPYGQAPGFGQVPDRGPADPMPVGPGPPREVPVDPLPTGGPPDALAAPDGHFPFEVIDATDELTVMMRRSKILRTPLNVYRAAVVDPSICNVVQFSPREVAILGMQQGATSVTFWFEGPESRPLTYLVRVTPDLEVQKRREEQYHLLEEILAELFPDSKVYLTPVADKLIVRGQAKDAEEAAQIMSVIRGQSAWVGGFGWGAVGGLVQGTAADPLLGNDPAGRNLPASQVVNMLRIPGEQQVALRVKIAELNRSKARRFGVRLDLRFDDGDLIVQSLLNVIQPSQATLLGSFDSGQINFGVTYLEREGVIRMVSEPTLVTLSGRPASFVAGGEFAVPTTVGVGGASAVTTDFRSFGAIITFLPVVLDKDRIRLQVAPEFSQVNTELSVNDTPGLNTRAVTTTVEMREGQTLAIAGLLDNSMRNDLTGDVPFLYRVLGLRTAALAETELLILVTPELVHPLDPEEVPPLPGFDVTEPTNGEFYWLGRTEGRPTLEYRSTVWPRLKRRYQAGGPAMISGPFGHGQ